MVEKKTGSSQKKTTRKKNEGRTEGEANIIAAQLSEEAITHSSTISLSSFLVLPHLPITNMYSWLSIKAILPSA